jgi:hypothetical protein
MNMWLASFFINIALTLTFVVEINASALCGKCFSSFN